MIECQGVVVIVFSIVICIVITIIMWYIDKFLYIKQLFSECALDMR